MQGEVSAAKTRSWGFEMTPNLLGVAPFGETRSINKHTNAQTGK